jgi:DNA invertase Pin-like site-specific DNA recombinase
MVLRYVSVVVYYGECWPRRGLGVATVSGERLTVERYAREKNYHIIEHFHEGPTGRYGTRPELTKALRRAKKADALLIIPEFQAVARSSVFLTRLWESGVEFLAIDNPYANKTTLPLLASVVIGESKDLSVRTRAALKKRKRRGVHLGMPTNLTEEGRRRGTEAMKEKGQASLTDHNTELLRSLRDAGKSLREIAAHFTSSGCRTKNGNPWSHTHVRRLLARLDELDRLRAESHAKWVAEGGAKGKKARSGRPTRQEDGE